MKYRRLGNTDMDVSVLSFGASSLGSVFRETDEAESIKVVHKAIEKGINLIDVAPWYGHGKAETVLGKALATVPRDKYFVATKVGRYLPDVENMFDFSAERTLASIDESLCRLGLDYVDIIQVHDMEFAPSLDIIINETLPALQKIKDAGKTRYIGITGYPLENFQTVIERSKVKIDTVLSYCHYSMNDTSLQDYIAYFQSCGVGLISASPISMGLLSSRGPPSWHPATTDIREHCREAAQYAQSNNLDIAKLAVKFSLENNDIPTTLVSTASEDELIMNIATANNDLTEHEQQAKHDIMERYMKPLNNANWANIEVLHYRKALKDLMKY